MAGATKVIIGVVHDLQGIAKAFPAAAPHVRDANDAIRQIMVVVMQNSAPGEPQAPPVNG